MNKKIQKTTLSEAHSKTILILLIISSAFLMLNFVSAVPPVTTTQQFTEGYSVQIPQDNVIKFNEDYNFDFHVFNVSNGIPKISGISCDFHLYNPLGAEIFAGTDSSAGATGDYNFNISRGNFSTTDNYYYFIRCNSSSLGGFSESILYITSSGRGIIGDNFLIFLYILIILSISSALFLFIINIGKFATLSTTLKDVALNWSFFFSYVLIYWLALTYSPDSFINNFSSTIITITAFINGLMPIIAFVVTLFTKGATKMRVSPQDLFGRERGYDG